MAHDNAMAEIYFGPPNFEVIFHRAILGHPIYVFVPETMEIKLSLQSELRRSHTT